MEGVTQEIPGPVEQPTVGVTHEELFTFMIETRARAARADADLRTAEAGRLAAEEARVEEAANNVRRYEELAAQMMQMMQANASSSSTPLTPGSEISTAADAPRPKGGDWSPPKWNGKSSTFTEYIEMLKLDWEARSELNPPISKKIAWNQIYKSIEDERLRARMRHYWITGAKSASMEPGLFIAEIEKVFSNSNDAAHARESLLKLKHRPGQPWRDHQRTFDALLLACGGEKFDDSVKIAHLKGSFSNEIRYHLVSMPNITDYHRFAEEVDWVAANYEETEEFRRLNRGWRGSHAAQGKAVTPSYASVAAPAQEQAPVDADGDTIMALTRTGANNGNGNRSQGSAQQRQGSANNNGKQAKRAAWASTAEMARRREKDLCYRCGKAGHRATQCSMRAAINPNKAVKIAAVNTEEGADQRNGDFDDVQSEN